MARLALVAALAVAGCSPNSGTLGPRRMNEPPPMMPDESDAGVTPPPPMDLPPDPRSEDCAGVAVAAETELRPVDIVWVVDSSGSMSNEAERVQENMNRFAAAVLMAGIDPHVVMITDSDYVRVPPPLGIDTEHYRFVERGVGSNAPLQRLLSEFPRYGDFLRPDAVLHFIAVTDDESDIGVGEFQRGIDLLLGSREYVFHAIASENDGGRECRGAAEIGETYYQLAAMTMGLEVSICTSDWTGVFTRLEEHIFASTPIPCELAIPEPPTDLALNYDRVNVEIQSPSGGPGVIPNVGDERGCVAGGWYYDDPASPSELTLCPTSCDAVNTLPDARVDVTFGCDTILL